MIVFQCVDMTNFYIEYFVSDMGPKAKGKMSLRRGNDPALEGRPDPLPKNQLPNYQEVGLALE